jgi:hypothetical protein
VALIFAGIDALIWIQQFDIQNGRILTPHRNRPGISNGIIVNRLIGIIDGETANRTIRIQGEKGLSFFAPAPCRYKQRRTIVARL